MTKRLILVALVLAGCSGGGPVPTTPSSTPITVATSGPSPTAAAMTMADAQTTYLAAAKRLDDAAEVFAMHLPIAYGGKTPDPGTTKAYYTSVYDAVAMFDSDLKAAEWPGSVAADAQAVEAQSEGILKMIPETKEDPSMAFLVQFAIGSHGTDLRTAVNALREALNLPQIAADTWQPA